MALINCIRCGNLFSPDRDTNICPACIANETEQLKKVTDYLRDFPLANAIEVSNRTGVEITQIFKFVRQGSLKIVDAPEEFKCRMCGKEVKKGTLCQDCIDKVGELKDSIKNKEKDRKRKAFEAEHKRHKRHRR